MALNLKDKKDIVAEVKEIAKSALFAVIVDYCGIKVDKITELRKKCREVGVYIRIIRNTLMRRIITGTPFECLKDNFFGPTMIAFSNKNPGSIARILNIFAKENVNFTVKAAAFKEKILSYDQINCLADLPTYEEAIIRLMLTIKEASVGKLIRTLAALCDKKEEL